MKYTLITQSNKKAGATLVLIQVMIALMLFALPAAALNNLLNPQDVIKSIAAEDIRQTTHLLAAFPGESAVLFKYDLQDDEKEEQELPTFTFTSSQLRVYYEDDTDLTMAKRNVYLMQDSKGIGTIQGEESLALYFDNKDIHLEDESRFFDKTKTYQPEQIILPECINPEIC